MSALNRDLGRGELRAALREAEARIEKAVALHPVVFDANDDEWCGYCDDDWPCPTVRALKGEP